MEAVFIKLLNISISAGCLILAVILLRSVLKKMPKWTCRILWGMVAVRLICPIFPESELSLSLNKKVIPDIVLTPNVLYFSTGVPDTGKLPDGIIGGHYYEGISLVTHTGYHSGISNIIEVLGWIWIVGMLAFAIYVLIAGIRLRYHVREAICEKENIWICDAVSSPFVLGVIRPRIYLSSNIGKEEADSILAHEKAHIKKKDYWWKPIGCALLAVYWFHPLVWIAYILFCRDIEMDCDEAVIGKASMEKKKSYSKALLACGMQRKKVWSCTLGFGEINVKKRVQYVLNYRKPTIWICIMATVVCVCVAVIFLTNPIKEVVHTEFEGVEYFPEYKEIRVGENCPVCKKGIIEMDTSWGEWVIVASVSCQHYQALETGMKDVTYKRKGARTKYCEYCQYGISDYVEKFYQKCISGYMY